MDSADRLNAAAYSAASNDAVGEDDVLWGNDYPHSEATCSCTLGSLI